MNIAGINDWHPHAKFYTEHTNMDLENLFNKIPFSEKLEEMINFRNIERVPNLLPQFGSW